MDNLEQCLNTKSASAKDAEKCLFFVTIVNQLQLVIGAEVQNLTFMIQQLNTIEKTMTVYSFIKNKSDMIQERLNDFRIRIENELNSYSINTENDWLNVLQSNGCSLRQIRSIYLMWLHLLVVEMENNPRFEYANTIEGVMGLNLHNANINEINNLVSNYFDSEGLFNRANSYYDIATARFNSDPLSQVGDGLVLINQSMFKKGELTTGGHGVGFPYYCFFHDWSFGDIAGKIRLLCENNINFGRMHAQPFLDVIRNVQFQNPILVWSNHNDYVNYLTTTPLVDGTQHTYLNSIEGNSFNALLASRGLPQPIYVIRDLPALADVLEELIDGRTLEAQNALAVGRESAKFSLCYFIKHLFNRNGINL